MVTETQSSSALMAEILSQKVSKNIPRKAASML